MRDWRKVHKGIRGSLKVRRAAYEARWLYVLLLSAQDDLGRYPWDNAKVPHLVAATTDWSTERATQLAMDLARCGLIETHADHVLIVGGKEKNGVPRPDVAPMYWPLPPCPDCPVAPAEPRVRAVAQPAQQAVRSQQATLPETELSTGRDEFRTSSIRHVSVGSNQLHAAHHLVRDGTTQPQIQTEAATYTPRIRHVDAKSQSKSKSKRESGTPAPAPATPSSPPTLIAAGSQAAGAGAVGQSLDQSPDPEMLDRLTALYTQEIGVLTDAARGQLRAALVVMPALTAGDVETAVQEAVAHSAKRKWSYVLAVMRRQHQDKVTEVTA